MNSVKGFSISTLLHHPRTMMNLSNFFKVGAAVVAPAPKAAVAHETKPKAKIAKAVEEDVEYKPAIMTTPEYLATVAEIEAVATAIGVAKAGGGDGRIDSAMKEGPFLEEMKRMLLEKHPDWTIVISPPRASCDILVNSIRINLKLTDCKSSDNSVNKPSIFYSITGQTTYPYSSNWNEFLDKLTEAKAAHQIKTERYKPTEYHYLVKNKLTGEVLLKPIFDIHTYVSNASNDLQINWKNEFANKAYATEDADYVKKVQSLLLCIQKSVKEMIERTRRFAEADVESLI